MDLFFSDSIQVQNETGKSHRRVKHRMRKFHVVVVQRTSKKWCTKKRETALHYSQFSPCGHRTITDTPFVAAKFLIISDLTETRFGYYGLSALWRSLTRHKLPNNSCLSFFSERFLVSISKSDSTQSLNKSDSSQRINQVQKIDNSACVFTVSMV